MVHLGSRFYLATDHTTLPIHRGNGTSLLSVKPLHVYNFLCDYSFYWQSTGLAECAPHLSFQFPVFHNNKFHFVSWQTLPLQNGSFLSDANFKIPRPSVIDNRTPQSLDDTYDTLDQDFTRRLQTLNKTINSVHEVSLSTSFEILLYFSFALARFNFLVGWLMYCVLSKRLSKCSCPRTTQPRIAVISHTSDQSTATSV